jgi:hypothetical protein
VERTFFPKWHHISKPQQLNPGKVSLGLHNSCEGMMGFIWVFTVVVMLSILVQFEAIRWSKNISSELLFVHLIPKWNLVGCNIRKALKTTFFFFFFFFSRRTVCSSSSRETFKAYLLLMQILIFLQASCF